MALNLPLEFWLSAEKFKENNKELSTETELIELTDLCITYINNNPQIFPNNNLSVKEIEKEIKDYFLM